MLTESMNEWQLFQHSVSWLHFWESATILFLILYHVKSWIYFPIASQLSSCRCLTWTAFHSWPDWTICQRLVEILSDHYWYQHLIQYYNNTHFPSTQQVMFLLSTHLINGSIVGKSWNSSWYGEKLQEKEGKGIPGWATSRPTQAFHPGS